MTEQEQEKILETKTTTEKEDLIYEDTSFLMKRGDYTVHVLIEEVKNILSKKIKDQGLVLKFLVLINVKEYQNQIQIVSSILLMNIYILPKLI